MLKEVGIFVSMVIVMAAVIACVHVFDLPQYLPWR